MQGILGSPELADIFATMRLATFAQKQHPEICEISGCCLVPDHLLVSILLSVGR